MKELVLCFKGTWWGERRTLPDLNDYIHTCTTHFAKAGSMKKKYQQIMGIMARQQNKERIKFDKPCRINFVFMEKDNRRDFDNISATAHKFILDTLQEVGILINDNQKIVREIRDKLYTTEKIPRIIVRIKELTDEEMTNLKKEKELFENYGGQYEQ